VAGIAAIASASDVMPSSGFLSPNATATWFITTAKLPQMDAERFIHIPFLQLANWLFTPIALTTIFEQLRDFTKSTVFMAITLSPYMWFRQKLNRILSHLLRSGALPIAPTPTRWNSQDDSP
jgi:hypothetical protein